MPPLRYGGSTAATNAKSNDTNRDELADLRLRYKRPGEDASRLIDAPILASSLRAQPSATLRFAAAVAAYADALRGGTHLGTWNWSDIAHNARSASGDDATGERAEFATLVDAARSITDGNATPDVASSD